MNFLMKNSQVFFNIYWFNQFNYLLVWPMMYWSDIILCKNYKWEIFSMNPRSMVIFFLVVNPRFFFCMTSPNGGLGQQSPLAMKTSKVQEQARVDWVSCTITLDWVNSNVGGGHWCPLTPESTFCKTRISPVRGFIKINIINKLLDLEEWGTVQRSNGFIYQDRNCKNNWWFKK